MLGTVRQDSEQSLSRLRGFLLDSEGTWGVSALVAHQCPDDVPDESSYMQAEGRREQDPQRSKIVLH